MTAITQFNDLFQKAKKGRSKEIRINIDLAEDLNTEISSFAIEMVGLQQTIIQLQKELLQRPTNVETSTDDYIDAGGFSF